MNFASEFAYVAQAAAVEDEPADTHTHSHTHAAEGAGGAPAKEASPAAPASATWGAAPTAPMKKRVMGSAIQSAALLAAATPGLDRDTHTRATGGEARRDVASMARPPMGPGRPVPAPAPMPVPLPPPGAPLTNVVAVNVGSVADEGNIATGDPVLCGSCSAVLSHTSKVSRDEPAPADGGAPSYSWTCEFCGAVNGDLRLADEELPAALVHTASSRGVDYLLTPPTSVTGLAGADDAKKDTSSLIFVCDTSGSMCISEPLADGIARRLRGNRVTDMQALRQAGDDANQLLPGERRGVTYVSRIQALQAAVANQIETIAKSRPEKRVGLVTFATDVTVFGDGTAEPRVLAGGRLTDYAALAGIGEGTRLTRGVKDAQEALVKRVYETSEEGQTALGPAVLVAVMIAAQTPGSKVVVITDGMSNVGLGALEPPEMPKSAPADVRNALLAEHSAKSDEFYGRVAAAALGAGVTVDVIGFEGAGCNLESLGRLSEATNGTVTRVNPATIVDSFANVLEDEVVATQCNVVMMAHAALVVRDPMREAQAEMLRRQLARATPAPLTAVGGAPPMPPVGSLGLSKVPSTDGAVAAAAEASQAALRSRYPMRTGKVRAQTFSTPVAAPPAESEAAAPAARIAPDIAAVPPPVTDPLPTAADDSATSKVTVYVGNVTRDTELTFEYHQRARAEMTPALQRELVTLTALPFQLQITYTRKDGSICMRVITSSQRTTHEYRKAEATMNASPLVAHAARTTAAYAKTGAYAACAAVTDVYRGYITRNVRADDAIGQSATSAYEMQAQQLTDALSSELASERTERSKKKSSAPGMSAPPRSRAAAAPKADAPAASGLFGAVRRFFSSSEPVPAGSAVPAAPAKLLESNSLAAPAAPPPPSGFDLSRISELDASGASLSSADEAMRDDSASDAEEESVATERIARRAGNDGLAAQIVMLGKGSRAAAKASMPARSSAM